ncbi:hypothetical protein CN154_28315 [Sinorhizobium meliloti]|uniref:hypothetical protein n=1 Tax=Rhizobium meliloti TaxID=382 RepID=UPI000FD7E8C3|nr:hypothetical protein [Sinorhizobium meliloti]RVK68097.1 hypothetical protein CN154_28315 [Sinorhizobium meliloti]
MQAREFVEDLKTAVLKAKAEGNAHVPVDALVDYLDSVPTATDPSPAAMEQYKAQLSAWVEEHKSRHSTDLEMFKSVITAGQGAIKTAFAMNSGAAVALLAFTGHLARFQPAQVPTLAWTLLPFTAGAFLAGFVSGTTYLSQWLYAGGHRKAGFALNILAIVLGLAAYGCFVWGMWWAIDAFLNFEAAPSTVADTP